MPLSTSPVPAGGGQGAEAAGDKTSTRSRRLSLTRGFPLLPASMRRRHSVDHGLQRALPVQDEEEASPLTPQTTGAFLWAFRESLTIPPSGRRHMTLPGFIRADERPQRDRRILYDLDQRARLQEEEEAAAAAAAAAGAGKGHTGRRGSVSSAGQQAQRKEKDPKMRREILRLYDMPTQRRYSPSTVDRLNSFFKLRKTRKRSFRELLHLLSLAIQDGNADLAYLLATKMSPRAIVRKDPVAMGRLFVLAMAARMEELCLLLMAMGFPPNVNSPVYTLKVDDSAATSDDEGSDALGFRCPSFFMLAISFCLEQVVMVMLKHGAAVDQSWYGLTPLMLAASVHGRGNARIVSMLLDVGADPALGVRHDQYCRLAALRLPGGPKGPRMPRQRSIVADNISVDGTPDVGSTPPPPPPLAVEPASAAAAPAAPEVPRSSSSVALGTSAIPLGMRQVRPLDVAVACNNRDIVALLLLRLNRQQVAASPFCLIVRQNAFIMAACLEAGADVRQTGARGVNALHLAVRRGDVTAVSLLLFYGAPLNDRGPHGWTALHEAIGSRQRAVARLLVHRGARQDRVNAAGQTPRELGLASGLTEDELDEYLDITRFEELDPPTPDIPALIAQAKAYSPMRRPAFAPSPAAGSPASGSPVLGPVGADGTTGGIKRVPSLNDLKAKAMLGSGRFSLKRRSFSMENEPGSPVIAGSPTSGTPTTSLPPLPAPVARQRPSLRQALPSTIEEESIPEEPTHEQAD